jgi:hypothetical protein
MQFAVMRPAKRHSELITDLEAETALWKAQMMRISGLPPADQAGLLGNKSQMCFVAQPAWRRDGEQALIDPAPWSWRLFALSPFSCPAAGPCNGATG